MSLLAQFNSLFKAKSQSGRVAVALSPSSVVLHSASISPEDKGFFASQTLLAGDNPATALKALLAENPVEGESVLVLAAGSYHLVQVDMPKVPQAELSAALVWQVKDLVPIEADDLLLDYYQLPIDSPANTKLNVVCASKRKVKALSDLLYKHDLTPKVITIPEFAFANLLANDDEARLLIYQQGAEELSIIIVKQRKLYFNRHLRGFADVGKMGLEQLSYGVVDSLSLEIQRSIDYFERQLKQAPIKHIQLLVCGDNEQHLSTLLAQNTHVPVSLLTIDKLEADKRHLAGSFGALLELEQVAQG